MELDFGSMLIIMFCGLKDIEKRGDGLQVIHIKYCCDQPLSEPLRFGKEYEKLLYLTHLAIKSIGVVIASYEEGAFVILFVQALQNSS